MLQIQNLAWKLNLIWGLSVELKQMYYALGSTQIILCATKSWKESNITNI